MLPEPTAGGSKTRNLRFGTPRHLLRGDVLDVRRDRPRVSARVRDRAEPVAPELIGDLHRDRRAG